MIREEEQLFPILADKIPLIILSKLIMEKELSIYDLNDTTNTVAQYRYALRKLLATNIIQSRKEKRKCYYSLSPAHKDKIRSVISCYLSFNRTNILKLMQKFDGWAFRGKSALLLYAPFLPLVSAKYTISVRSVKEQEKIRKLIPEIGSIFDIIIQPTYFRTATQYIRKFNGYPVLRPEIIYSNLLKFDDARVRIATIFLLPYMQRDFFYNQVQKDKRIFLTTVYLLFSLSELLQEEKEESARTFFKTWFYNLDQLDHERSFDRFLKIYPQTNFKKKASNTFFRSLQNTWKKQYNSYSKWDQAADLVADRLVTFQPESLDELVPIEP